MEINLAKPWLDEFRGPFDAMTQSGDWVQQANVLAQKSQLVVASGTALSFRSSCAQESSAYETGIFETGSVPCRNASAGFTAEKDRHDFYNALIWLSFPATKARLNQLQAAELRKKLGAARGALRDAITLFDENALLLVSDDLSFGRQLADRQWQALLFDRRDDWAAENTEAKIRPICFGHALLHKLENPFKAITAHVLLLPAAPSLKLIDQLLAKSLTQELLSAKPFLPLPVLGIPGWCEHNQHSHFYNDPQIFRAERKQ